MTDAIFFEIKSESVKGKIHIVRKLTNDIWKCDCWPYIKTGNCKHIEKAKSKKTTENRA